MGYGISRFTNYIVVDDRASKTKSDRHRVAVLACLLPIEMIIKEPAADRGFENYFLKPCVYQTLIFIDLVPL